MKPISLIEARTIFAGELNPNFIGIYDDIDWDDPPPPGDPPPFLPTGYLEG